MRFVPTGLDGAVTIEMDLLEDHRGFFARTWCTEEFAERGLNPRVVQCSVSYSRLAGTLRGLHYQAGPHEEAKLVRCTAGAVHDVIVDLRPGSATYLCHAGVELSAGNHRLLYVPEGFAHGFVTLADDTEVFYQMSERHVPTHARGVRWDDPALGIEWPVPPSVISGRDRSYPDFDRSRHAAGDAASPGGRG
jgi:dTDP-4-dehydrorhamnose 3,5-epimerase